MLDHLMTVVLREPRRTVALGHAVARAANFFLVVGLLGKVATIAAEMVKSLGRQEPAHVTLADIFPGIPTWWVPESEFGFAMAILGVVAGFALVATGRTYQRYLNA
jgi:hypothetical protein